MNLNYIAFRKRMNYWEQRIADDMCIILCEEKAHIYDEYKSFLKEYSTIIKLNRVHAYFSLPMVVIHELMHVIAAAIVFYRFEDISFRIDNYGYNNVTLGWPDGKMPNVFQVVFFNLAPAYFFFFVLIYSFFNPLFWYVALYVVLTYPYSKPSPKDIEGIKDVIEYHRSERASGSDEEELSVEKKRA